VLSYQRLKDHPRALRTFTGLDQAEFENLLPHFEMAYHAYRYEHHVKKKARKRRYGGGRKPRLASMEDKLLFILFYPTLSNLCRKSLDLLHSAILAVVISPINSKGVLNVGSMLKSIPCKR
jgi:hypothetical protein